MPMSTQSTAASSDVATSPEEGETDIAERFEVARRGMLQRGNVRALATPHQRCPRSEQLRIAVCLLSCVGGFSSEGHSDVREYPRARLHSQRIPRRNMRPKKNNNAGCEMPRVNAAENVSPIEMF